MSRLNQLRLEVDDALEGLAPKPLRPSQKSRGPRRFSSRRLFVPAVACFLGLFATLTIITGHGSHSSALEHDANVMQTWRSNAKQALSSYAEQVKQHIPVVEVDLGGIEAEKEAAEDAAMAAAAAEDDDEVHLDDIEGDGAGGAAGEGEEEGGPGGPGDGPEGAKVDSAPLDLSDVLRGTPDDGTCGSKDCRPHGYCKRGECYCVAAFEGPDCKDPRPLPNGLKSKFEGNFVLNQAQVRRNEGIKLKTNPKAGRFRRGQTHTLYAPLVHEDRAKYDRNFKHGRTKNIERQRKSVITPTLLKSMPELDFLNATVFDRCAIVGSSGLSKLYKGGEEIDSHDAVIRFNSAPTVVKPRRRRRGSSTEGVSYVEHVGRKTTFRFINTQHIRFFEGKEIRLQQMQSKNGLFRYLIYRKRYPKSRLFAFDTDFTSYVSSNIPVLPTGGYFAALFAIQLCHKVNMYGFHWQPGHAIAHHYFNSEVPVEGKEKIHDYDAEHTNLLHIARAGMLNLSQPCVPGCEAKTQIRCETCPPGSTCGCGANMPTPLSIPGFCHLKHNYTCYYRCPRQSQCPGGPSSSRCPNSLLNYFADKPCASAEDVPQRWSKPGSLKSHPRWMKDVYDLK